jgi:small subunit ribosomal protein S4
MQRHDQRQIPEWVHVDTENMRGVVQALPKRDDITLSIQEQLVVELYSK